MVKVCKKVCIGDPLQLKPFRSLALTDSDSIGAIEIITFLWYRDVEGYL